MLDAYKVIYIDAFRATTEFEHLITYPDGEGTITGTGNQIRYPLLPANAEQALLIYYETQMASDSPLG